MKIQSIIKYHKNCTLGLKYDLYNSIVKLPVPHIVCWTVESLATTCVWGNSAVGGFMAMEAADTAVNFPTISANT